jgi:hypothetical protein
MPYKKKGKRTKLLELARKKPAKKPAAKKKAATKKKPTAQAPKFGARIPVGSGKSTTKAQTSKSSRPKVTQPTVGTPPRNLRTPAQRAADKKKLLAEQQALRTAGNKKSLTRFIPQTSVKGAEKVGRALELGGTTALLATPFAPAAAKRLAATTAGAKVASTLSKAKKARDAAKASKVTRGIGSTRAASAAARTSGLGKAKPTKPKSKKGPSKFLSDILKRASGIGKPKSSHARGWDTRRKNAAEKARRDKRAAMRR